MKKFDLVTNFKNTFSGGFNFEIVFLDNFKILKFASVDGSVDGWMMDQL